MNLALNLYLAFFSFLLGLIFGFGIQWLRNNHHHTLLTFIVVIMVGFLGIDGIMSIFNPDTLLRQTYSELQGWVDFVFGAAGCMLGFYLEDRYEQNRRLRCLLLSEEKKERWK